MKTLHLSTPRETALPFGFNLRGLGVLFACFLVVACWLLTHRGPWLDEFWSLWLAGHDLPLTQIVRERWMVDFNPPLFSLVHWMLMPLIGDTLPAHRFINLLALAWAAVFTVLAIRRFPGREAFVIVFAALVLALPSTLSYLAEMRSYFAQVCVHYVLVATTVLMADSGDAADADLDWTADRGFAAMVVASIAVAINMHYISTLLACIVMTGLVCVCLAQGRRRWALTLAAATLVSLIPVLGYMATQLPFLLDSSKHYWVRGSMGHATLWLGYIAFEAAASNIVAALVAVLVIAASAWAGSAVVRSLLPARAASFLGSDSSRRLVLTAPRWRAAYVLFAVLLTFGVAMLLAHAHQPIVTRRYLVNFQVVAAGLVACLAAEALARRRWLIVSTFVVALIGIAVQGRKIGLEDRWDASARSVAAASLACAGSPVYAVIVTRPTFSANEIDVLRWAYQQQANRHGISFEYREVGRDTAPLRVAACPTLLWVEHVDWEALGRGASDRDLLRLVGLDPAAIDPGKVGAVRTETGVVLSLAPA